MRAITKIPRTLSTFLVFCTTLAFLPLVAAAAPQQGQGPRPVVGVATATLQDANLPKKYIGHVEALESIDLKARVAGYLEQVNFAEGSVVKKGQTLYVIEQAPYQARVAAARARVAQAEADLFKAQTKLNRLRSAGAGSVPQTDMDDAKAAYDLAQARLLESQANLQLSEIDLGYTTIKAPLDGRIGKSFYKKGDLISSTSGSMAEVVSVDPIRVLFSVNERQTETIRKAATDAAKPAANPSLKIRVSTTDGKEYPQTGRVEFIDNKMDSSTGTIAIWSIFTNPQGHLLPGAYVNVSLTPAAPSMQISIPQAAMQRDREGAYVLVVDNNSKIEKRKIEAGKTSGRNLFVISGLTEGELVVYEGTQKVVPGAEVNMQLKEDKDN
ncbi:MAG: efflux RND transporter periplasmic adaptor subunit [Desulfuromonadaceae bacterium]|nr:efflux RND transporter periplasmic adaptor subunit [Desulfuromonas sp.]MDY0184393.1 efflux RND transporter periplasmic adaptor subunit [Desulfuromonadaceae bacterium]